MTFRPLFPTANLFSWVEIDFNIKNRLQETQPNQILPKHVISCRRVFSLFFAMFYKSNIFFQLLIFVDLFHWHDVRACCRRASGFLLYCSSGSTAKHSTVQRNQPAQSCKSKYVPTRVRKQAARAGKSQHMSTGIYTAR